MTFSLAGRCGRTGMMGGVVTTSSPAVGSRCLFAKAKVGVVLTQFWTDPRLGPRGIALLSEGLGAQPVLDAVVASTTEREWRQLAVLDARGMGAHHSGTRNKPALGAAIGPDCVSIGNILRNDTVPAAMVAAFAAEPGLPLADRLLAALDAGLAAGGEEKDLVSASLMVVHEAPFPYVDLRVDVSAAPLTDLRRAWTMFAPMADTYTGRAMRPHEM